MDSQLAVYILFFITTIKTEKMKRARLQNYIFHYNPYDKMWHMIPRDSYVDYWNGKCTNCTKNKSLRELLKTIIK